MKLPFERAGVVGLGLIGGSMARDLSAHGIRVKGYDANPAELAAAMDDGVIETALDESLAGLADSDLVVIAVPVDVALDVLTRAASYLGSARLVTDVGSTKAGIIARAAELGIGDRFVGSHPMAGDHRSGWAASRAGLFEQAPTYLCASTSVDPAALRMADDLWRSLGASPIAIDATVHDDRLAWTSHLPHMIAVALGLALADGSVQRDELGPGGRDMTRIAGSSADMWTAIALDNAPAIQRALLAAERELGTLREAIAQDDAATIHERFTAARSWFYASA